MKQVQHSFTGIRQELAALRHGQYPPFVVGDDEPARLSGIPVFVYHTVEPDELEEHLDYLQVNGYGTLSADEYHDILTGLQSAPRDAVLLTIDDGRQSVWTYGEPLLRRFGARATVFLIPGYVAEGQGCRPSLEDVWAGRCGRDDLVSDDSRLMNWQEIGAAHARGHIDFQAHTLYHHRVGVGRRVVDFYRPGDRTAFYDIPVPAELQACVGAESLDSVWGAPLYECDSLMSGRPRYLPSPGMPKACVDFVAAHGGAAFFRKPGWRRKLLQIVRAAERLAPSGVQSMAELRDEIASNLQQCRDSIEARLAGKQVRHLCYPYGIGSGLSVELSREAGYSCNYWLMHPGRAENRVGQDPYQTVRLKHDFLLRLPGTRRKSLRQILARKVLRRLSGGTGH